MSSILVNPAIREGRLDDYGTLVDFQIAMALETEGLALDLEICSKGVLGVFENPARGNYFIAESGGRIIGSLLIIPEWSDWRNRTVWWIHSVYVLPEMRDMKVFSHFYRFLRSRVEENSELAGLRLYVDKRNSNAQNIYTRLGMSNHHYDLFEWMKS